LALEDAEARARNIKVLIFDVDGVLTDGTLTFIPKLDGSAAEIKPFHAHDGLGIALARIGGLRVGIITKRHSQTVAVRARDLHLEFVYQGQAYKAQAAKEIAAKAGITMDEMCFVGDDVIDLPVMRICALGYAAPRRRWSGARCDRVHPEGAGFARARDRAIPRRRESRSTSFRRWRGEYVEFSGRPSPSPVFLQNLQE
jgi:3-deoxy-D-manno-octulosonate 8-phosphate phosphatase (KDO 8-P phosphatase)